MKYGSKYMIDDSYEVDFVCRLYQENNTLNYTVEPLLYDHPQNHIGVVV